MKFEQRFLIVVAVVLVMGMVFAAAPVMAQTTFPDDELVGKSYYNVNVRTAPGTDRPIIGTVPAGSEFVAIGRDESNSWVQVQFEETIGWAAAWLFVFEKDSIDLRVTTDVEPPLASGPGPFETLIPFTMNMRAAPSTEAGVVAELPYLSRVEATARDETNSWVLVEYDDQEGWIALWLIVLLGDVNALPLDETTITVAAPQTTATPVPVTGITVTAPYTINMRTAPEPNADVVAELPFGLRGNAIGRNAGGNWILIEYDDEVGWVARWLVSVSDNFAGLPVRDDSDEAVPTIEPTITAQAVYDLVIRTDPGGNQYPVVGQVAAGQTIEPLARSEDSNWLRVSVDGVEGWIAAWPMIANADLNLLPVE